MNTGNRLIVELFNPQRQLLLDAMGSQAPSKYEILVEGWSDLFFFVGNVGQNLPRGNARFLPVEEVSDGGGKTFVISQMDRDEKYLGVVDMDHDFQSTSTSFSEKIGDTSEQCCLFSWVMDKQNKGIPDVTCEFIRYLIRDSRATRAQASIRERESEFTEFVMETTRAILFRGWAGDLPIRGQSEVAWELIGDLRASVRHLIPDAYVERFEEFKVQWDCELEEIGPNDHALASGVVLLLIQIGDKREQEEITRVWQ